MSTPKLLHRSFVVRLAQGETALEGEIPVIASSEALDDYGEIIEQSSWRLERFLRNPIGLWQHEPWEDPVGYFKDVRVENGALRATLVPYTGAADPKGRGTAVLARYAQGGPISVSVGFYNSGTSDTEERDGQKVRVLRDCELYEISVVSIGANPEAVALRASLRLRERRAKGTPMTFSEYLAARGMSPEECASATGLAGDELTALIGGAAPTEEQAAKLATGLGLAAEEVAAMFPAKAADPPPAEETEAEKSAAALGRRVLAALGMKSPEAAFARVQTLVDSEKGAKDLAQRVARLEGERRTERRAKVLADARADGRLPLAREKKLEGYLAKLSDPDALSEFLSTLEPAVDTTERKFPPPGGNPPAAGKGALYTDEQRAAALAANDERRAGRQPR